MTRKQKILQVLKNIKHESEINSNPKWVEFKFNASVVGEGSLTNDQKKRILIKIEKDGIIEIHIPDKMNDQEKTMTPIEFMMKHNFIWIKILPPFYKKYFWYNLISLVDNKWNYINPFWILWQLIRCIVFLIEWLWDKSKVVTIIISMFSGILVYNWSLAWKNIKIILDYLEIL